MIDAFAADRVLRAAIGEGEARAADEMGDLLFSIANLSRKLGLDPESALRQANDKFTRRFAAVERRLAGKRQTVHDATPDELEAAWNAVKHSHVAKPPSATSGRRRSARRRSGRRSR